MTATTTTTNPEGAHVLALAFLLVPTTERTATAYVVETPEGRAFVPVTRVTPLKPATPLVVFA